MTVPLPRRRPGPPAGQSHDRGRGGLMMTPTEPVTASGLGDSERPLPRPRRPLTAGPAPAAAGWPDPGPGTLA